MARGMAEHIAFMTIASAERTSEVTMASVISGGYLDPLEKLSNALVR